jgi:pyruvate, water dikinase
MGGRNISKKEYVRHFNYISKEDVGIAGGKGASLGEMTRAGIPVPEGFVILSSTFDEFIKVSELTAEIETILKKVDKDKMHTIEFASETIQSLIIKCKIPKPIVHQIMEAYSKLNARYVAVRSSATSEDSASAAWAGQLDSYLNTTQKMLLDNVRRCWASLFTPRAIFYRIEKELHKEHVSVAVVVQKMVDSEVSGIAFSVHPVTQDRNQIIIEAGFGLGEAIVSGQITPDSYITHKKGLHIIEKNISSQNRMLVKVKDGGNEWVDVDGSMQKMSDSKDTRTNKYNNKN